MILLMPLLGTAAKTDLPHDIRPNVILFLSDDHGVRDSGPYGAVDVKTPHLDALAAESLRFTRAYAVSATCVPTRSSLYTGLFPLRHGAHRNHSQVSGTNP